MYSRQTARETWMVRDQRTGEEQAKFLCGNVEETSTGPLQWRHGGVVSDLAAVGQESTTAGQVFEE